MSSKPNSTTFLEDDNSATWECIDHSFDYTGTTSHRSNMPHPPTAAQFELMGRRIASYQFSRSQKILRKRFVEHFGTDPFVVQLIWMLIYNAIDLKPHQKNPDHLLWAFYFLKGYETEGRCASRCGCDEKTFRKWIWLYIGIVADFDVDVVSSCCYLCCCFN
jgi:hypothetical protein